MVDDQTPIDPAVKQAVLIATFERLAEEADAEGDAETAALMREVVAKLRSQSTGGNDA